MISMEECSGSHNAYFVIQRRGLFNEEQTINEKGLSMMPSPSQSSQ
jgi:hypothetical protein